MTAQDVLYAFSGFVADPVRGLLRRHGETVALPPKAFEVLVALIERRGRIVEKDELFRAVWPNTSVEENNLARHISTLRKVLHDGLTAHDYIVTVPGRGYRFVATLQEFSRVEPEPEALSADVHLWSARVEERVREAGLIDTAEQAQPVVVNRSVVDAGSRPSRAVFGLVALVLTRGFVHWHAGAAPAVRRAIGHAAPQALAVDVQPRRSERAHLVTGRPVDRL